MTAWPRVQAWRRDGAIYRRVTDLAYDELEWEPRHNQAGPCSLALPMDERTQKLDKRHLITVDWSGLRYTARVVSDEPVEEVRNQRPRWVRRVTGLDALSVLDVRGYPAPDRAADAQNLTHYRRTGDAETVLRDFIQANYVLRLGRPLDIALSEGRGGTVTLNSRMDSVLGEVVAKCEAGGLGVRVGLVSPTLKATTATLRCEFYQPRDRSLRVKLSRRAGTVKSWRYSDQAPTMTRAIVMGGGKGTARIIRVAVDEAAEAEWDVVIEGTVDARDESDPAVLIQRGEEALAEAAKQSAFEVETALPEGVVPGVHFNVGDTIPVDLGLPGLVSSERLGAMRLAANAQSGVTVQLVPGNPDSGTPMFAYKQIVRGMARQVEQLKREQ